MIDTHAHLNYDEYMLSIDKVLNDIESNGVEKVIIPGVAPDTFDTISSLCEQYDMLYMALGVHPSECETYDILAEKKILEFSYNKKLVAIGEIGLDYHYDSENKQAQQKVFISQLELAQKMNLPVLIHDREAHEDCFHILQDFKLKDVIFHCFSGTPKFAEKCIEQGYYIAVGGIVTFKNAKDLKESVKIVPLDKLLLETDCPYLAPVPFRGKVNTPAYLKYIAQEVANIKEINIDEVNYMTTINAERIFRF